MQYSQQIANVPTRRRSTKDWAISMPNATRKRTNAGALREIAADERAGGQEAERHRDEEHDLAEERRDIGACARPRGCVAGGAEVVHARLS